MPRKNKRGTNILLNSAVSRKAAVNGNDYTRNKAGSLFRAEPQKCTGKVVGFTEAVHGGSAQNLFGSCGGLTVLKQQVAVLICYKLRLPLFRRGQNALQAIGSGSKPPPLPRNMREFL